MRNIAKLSKSIIKVTTLLGKSIIKVETLLSESIIKMATLLSRIILEKHYNWKWKIHIKVDF